METSFVQSGKRRSQAEDAAANPERKPHPGPALFELLTILAITLAAGWLRLVALEAAPPSLWVDEAINGLDVYRIFAGLREPFLENGGREALFIYLQAFSVYVFGASAWSLHLVSALVGTLTVLATWALNRALFGRWAALVAAGLLATLVWHIVLSRVGLRAICAPLVLALVLWSFWRTLRFGRLRDGLLMGIALGLSLQTYLSTRVIPFLLVLLFLAELRLNRAAIVQRWKPVLLAAAVAVILLLPLIHFFLSHPAQLKENLLYRTAQVTIRVGPPREGDIFHSSIFESIPRTLAMFNFEGDENWRHNVSHRPAFDPITGAFFLIGIVMALMRLNRPAGSPVSEPEGRKSAGPVRVGWRAVVLHPNVWLVTSFVVLLLPGIATDGSPHFLRMLIILPVLVAFPSLALVSFARWFGRTLTSLVRRRFSDRPLPGIMATAFLSLYLLAQGVIAYVTYWGEWAPAAGTWWAFNGPAIPAQSTIRQFLAGGGNASALTIYCPLLCRHSSILAFLEPAANSSRRLDLVTTVYPLFGPLNGEHVQLVLGTDRFDLAGAYFDEASSPVISRAPDGAVGMVRTSVPAGAIERRLGELVATNLDFDGLRLLGAGVHVDTAPPAAKRMVVDLYWQVVRGGGQNYSPVVRLVDQSGTTLFEDAREGIVIGGWQPGDRFLSRHVLTLPEDRAQDGLALEVAIALRTTCSSPDEPTREIGQLGAPVRLQPLEIGGDLPRASTISGASRLPRAPLTCLFVD